MIQFRGPKNTETKKCPAFNLFQCFLSLPLLFPVPAEECPMRKEMEAQVVYGYLGIFSVVGLEAFESTPRPPKAVFPRRVETRL